MSSEPLRGRTSLSGEQQDADGRFDAAVSICRRAEPCHACNAVLPGPTASIVSSEYSASNQARRIPHELMTIVFAMLQPDKRRAGNDSGGRFWQSAVCHGHR